MFQRLTPLHSLLPFRLRSLAPGGCRGNACLLVCVCPAAWLDREGTRIRACPGVSLNPHPERLPLGGSPCVWGLFKNSLECLPFTRSPQHRDPQSPDHSALDRLNTQSHPVVPTALSLWETEMGDVRGPEYWVLFSALSLG